MKTNQHNKRPKNGLQKEYFRDVGKYIDGKKTGVWKIYDTNGNLRKTKTHQSK